LLAFTMAMPGMLRLMVIGALAIVVAVPAIGWVMRRRRAGVGFA